MAEQKIESDDLSEPQIEWAVEVTWVDWKKAGAKGPTSQYGPFENEGHRDRFLDAQRRDREIAATRVLTRLAAYTPWTGPREAEATSEEDRAERLDRYYAEMFPHLVTPSAQSGTEGGDR